MKVDTRYRMHGIINANHVISMMEPAYWKIKKWLDEEFGQPVYTDQALNHNMIGNWYLDMDPNEIFSVYFPNDEDIEVVKKYLTFAKLNLK